MRLVCCSTILRVTPPQYSAWYSRIWRKVFDDGSFSTVLAPSWIFMNLWILICITSCFKHAMHANLLCGFRRYERNMQPRVCSVKCVCLRTCKYTSRNAREFTSWKQNSLKWIIKSENGARPSPHIILFTKFLFHFRSLLVIFGIVVVDKDDIRLSSTQHKVHTVCFHFDCMLCGCFSLSLSHCFSLRFTLLCAKSKFSGDIECVAYVPPISYRNHI